MNSDPVREFIEQKGQGIPMATGADEEVYEQYAGMHYRIKPGEIFRVQDRKEHPRSSKDQKPDLTATPTTVPGGDAASIVTALLATDRLGRKGAYVVVGDGKDDQRRAEGRKRWLAWRASVATTKQAWWMKYVGAAKATPDSPPPIMPQDVRREVEFLTRYRTEISLADRKRYICTIDGMDFDRQEDARAYVSTLHAHKVQDGSSPDLYIQDNQALLQSAAFAGNKAREEAEAPAPAPQRPVETFDASQIAEGVKVLSEAKAAGVKMLREERVKLQAGDPYTIRFIRQQIAEKVAATPVVEPAEQPTS